MVKLFQTKSGYHTVGQLCGSVEPLSKILGSEHIQGLPTKLPKTHFGYPNFRMWSTYMNMVEVLLDFIRAEKDGNSTLHLEAFAAMLPWLTIYDHKICPMRHVYLVDMKLIEMTAPGSMQSSCRGN